MPPRDSDVGEEGAPPGDPAVLVLSVGKFAFKVATDRLYGQEGTWAKGEGNRVRIGLSDYLQQRSGDMAFAEVKAVGTEVSVGGELAVVETVKVNVSLSSPVTGRVVEVNPLMAGAPEVINQDPYGTGWMAVVEARDWQADSQRLLEPQAFWAKMKREAEQEVD